MNSFRNGSCDETDPGGAEPPKAPRAPPRPCGDVQSRRPSFVFLAAFCATPDDSVRLQNALTDLIQKPLALQQIEESFLKQRPVVAGKTPFFA
jgi:hypothetical protein